MASKIQDEGLSLLDRFMGQSMEFCKEVYRGHTGIIHLSLYLYHIFSKEQFTNMDLNPSCPTGQNSLWKHFQECKSLGEDMALTAAKAQALYIWLATNNQISRASKVGLQVFISKEDLLRELGMTCYIVTVIYGANFLLTSPS